MQKLTSKLGRSLLTTTALTVGAGAALAGTITENVAPAPLDFPNTANGFVLPDATTQVNGSTGPTSGESFDGADWFTFNNLGAGSFVLSGFSQGSNTYVIQTSGGGSLGSGSLPGAAQDLLSGAIPVDGELVVGVFAAQESGGPFQFNLSTQASGVPEPADLAPVGLALAGALAWRRRSNK